MSLTNDEKEKVESIMKSDQYEVSYIENRKKLRNGLILVMIDHESQTLPNKWINSMLEIGFCVSCVCGDNKGNIGTAVYFERIKGASF